MKSGTEHLLKFQHLMRDLDIPEYEATGVLQTLWNKTALNCPRGDIGRFSNEDIGVLIGWRRDPDQLIEALVRRRWLDEHPEHRLIIHDWPSHCENSTHGKLARAMQFFADGTEPTLRNLGKRASEIIEWYEYQRKIRENIRISPPDSSPYTDILTKNEGISTPTVTVTVALDRNRNRNRTDGTAHKRTGNGTGKPAHIGDIVPDLTSPANPTPPPAQRQSLQRVLAATGEPPEAGAYWADVGERLKAVGENDVLRDGVLRLESKKPGIDKPAAWLNRQASRALKRHNVQMPPPWQARSP